MMACVWWLGRVLNFCVLGSLLSLSCFGNGLRIQLSDFALAGSSAAPAGWLPWAQREEVMPRCYIDATQFRSKSSALAISGNSNAAEYGGWTYRLGHVQAGKFTGLRRITAPREWTTNSCESWHAWIGGMKQTNEWANPIMLTSSSRLAIGRR